MTTFCSPLFTSFFHSTVSVLPIDPPASPLRPLPVLSLCVSSQQGVQLLAFTLIQSSLSSKEYLSTVSSSSYKYSELDKLTSKIMFSAHPERVYFVRLLS